MSEELTPVKPEWIAPIESRKQRADYYFQTILEDQRGWYEKKASCKKQLHYGFAISVVIFGAVISCLQAVDAQWVRYVTTLLGAGVTILRSFDTLLHPGETWLGYRKAEENMKREYRLYLNNADAYGEAADEMAAYRLLVARVENAIAEEQQLFWQFQDKKSQPSAAESEDK